MSHNSNFKYTNLKNISLLRKLQNRYNKTSKIIVVNFNSYVIRSIHSNFKKIKYIFHLRSIVKKFYFVLEVNYKGFSCCTL